MHSHCNRMIRVDYDELHVTRTPNRANSVRLTLGGGNSPSYIDLDLEDLGVLIEFLCEFKDNIIGGKWIVVQDVPEE